jgi:D-inositol-3-phosphate glycosyltransferase
MKKRIACITEYASLLVRPEGTKLSGHHAYVSELMMQLADKGWEVDVFTRQIDTAQPQVTTFGPGVRVIQINASTSTAPSLESELQTYVVFASEIKNFIVEENIAYDLIHANDYTSGLVAMDLKRKFKIPFIFTFHEFGHVLNLQDKKEGITEARIKIEQQITKKADLLIVECPQDKADLIEYYQASSKKTFVVPCGFNPNLFFPIDKREARRKLNMNADEKILLQIGSLVPHKGIDNVIKSMALLDARNQNLRLIVLAAIEQSDDAKAYNELERLKLLATNLGLAGQITFDAKIDAETLPFYYAAADLFVNTPVFEGLGITPLEAMACGTPVIGSEVGAIKFAVVDGKTGFIIPANAPELLADRIRLMIKNEALLEQMSRNSVTHVNSSFTWKTVAEQMIDLYEYVLLTKIQKEVSTKPASIKNVNRSIPLRNVYLKRNMHAKYGN